MALVIAPTVEAPVAADSTPAAGTPRRADGRVRPKLAYRRDIDGLRALAVLPVVAFHIEPAIVRGGFVGVDIFFVISGYLVGGIILSDLADGTFTFRRFYERRIRRIVPALAITLAACTIGGWLWLFPRELTRFGQSLLATVFSVSNLYFAGDTGYFAAAATAKPLLHTWSLAVEEQFYVLLPLCLVFLHRRLPRRLPAVVILLALASFAMSAYGAFAASASTFYLPQVRAWELLLGVILALGVIPEMTGPLSRNIAAGAGVILIGVAVLVFTAETPFPGVAALVPCGGAALILLAGRSGSSLPGRLLSLRPVVFIGMISYSLYLWHWPVVVFFETGVEFLLPGMRSLARGSVLLGVSLVLATLSWRFVEAPFRTRQVSASRVVRLAIASGVALAAFAGIVMLSGGLPDRYRPEVTRLASYLDPDAAPVEGPAAAPCHIRDIEGPRPSDACHQLSGDRRDYLVIGDSHASHLIPGLSKIFPDLDFLAAVSNGCRPLIAQPASAKPECAALMKFAFEGYLSRHHVDRLIMAGRWGGRDLDGLTRTLAWLEQRRIDTILMGPMIQYDNALPRLMAASLQRSDPDLIVRHRVDNRALDTELAALAGRFGAVYVSYYSLLCASGDCVTRAGEVPLQYDYGHLTAAGSSDVALRLREGHYVQ